LTTTERAPVGPENLSGKGYVPQGKAGDRIGITWGGSLGTQEYTWDGNQWSREGGYAPACDDDSYVLAWQAIGGVGYIPEGQDGDHIRVTWSFALDGSYTHDYVWWEGAWQREGGYTSPEDGNECVKSWEAFLPETPETAEDDDTVAQITLRCEQQEAEISRLHTSLDGWSRKYARLTAQYDALHEKSTEAYGAVRDQLDASQRVLYATEDDLWQALEDVRVLRATKDLVIIDDPLDPAALLDAVEAERPQNQWTDLFASLFDTQPVSDADPGPCFDCGDCTGCDDEVPKLTPFGLDLTDTVHDDEVVFEMDFTSEPPGAWDAAGLERLWEAVMAAPKPRIWQTQVRDGVRVEELVLGAEEVVELIAEYLPEDSNTARELVNWTAAIGSPSARNAVQRHLRTALRTTGTLSVREGYFILTRVPGKS
jgi:hypothetical protein